MVQWLCHSNTTVCQKSRVEEQYLLIALIQQPAVFLIYRARMISVSVKVVSSCNPTKQQKSRWQDAVSSTSFMQCTIL